ncbi:SPFH domain-containing protein [Streptomyces sp. NPDC127051]|uniref:SPFH domain-containing protein n=1 Tax=Streptomyces sp. NPDC127051 TaxID=3347119 RepID=UPI0036550226
MYPTRTTSTTGTFRVPPAPPQAPAVRVTGDAPALRQQPAPSTAAAAPAPQPARPAPEPVAAAAVIPAPLEAPVGAGGAQVRSDSELPEDRVPGAEAAVPGVDAADTAVPAWVAGVPVRMVAGPVGVALPHGRPAADSAVSEVPAARIRVEPEPVHALAGAGDRAEYGQEPDPLVSVPGPAAHPGVSTLRLRGFDGPAEPPSPHAQLWPPAGPEAQPLPGHPAHARVLPPGGPEAGPGADGSAPTQGAPWPLAVPQGEARTTPRAPLGQLWPASGPDAGADRPAQRYGEPWPSAVPQDEAGQRAPHPHAEAEPGSRAPHAAGEAGAEPVPQDPYVPHPHDGADADPAAQAEPGADDPAPRHGEPWPLAVPQGEARTTPRALGQIWPAAGSEAGADRPAQRYGEPWPPAAPEAGSGAESAASHAPHVPQPHAAVPGPAVGDIVARAVARGMAEGDTEDLPRVGAVRGAAATEVPVHLPFPAESRPVGAAAPAPAREPAPASRPRAARPVPGRRVPRGDERLREHRGPVLPGWVGVGVGGLALTGCLAVLWRAGAVPAAFVAAFGATPRAYQGLRATHWPPLAFLGIVALLAIGGLGRAKAGHAWVLTLFGRYRGTVRRTGLTWVSPLLLRRRVDVRLRHWRSEPMPAVDSGGLALRVVVQVVWQVKDTARATLAVEDHTEYLAEQVESAMARVLSQLPADAFHEDAPTLRDSEAVGDALTRMLATETEAVGIEVYSAQPTRIEYAPEVAEAMRRRRVAAIDAKHRDTVLTSVVDAVDDTVHRLTSRGLVELDDYERKALVKDLTVAFYTGRPE